MTLRIEEGEPSPMIETLRLGTRVVTTNPVWPHIRKVAHHSRHTQYVFTRAEGVEAIADSTRFDEAADGSVLRVGTNAYRLADSDWDALVAYIRADLEVDPAHAPGPMRVEFLNSMLSVS